MRWNPFLCGWSVRVVRYVVFLVYELVRAKNNWTTPAELLFQQAAIYDLLRVGFSSQWQAMSP